VAGQGRGLKRPVQRPAGRVGANRARDGIALANCGGFFAHPDSPLERNLEGFYGARDAAGAAQFHAIRRLEVIFRCLPFLRFFSIFALLLSPRAAARR
jgi:hypothetical protein